jgi:hypothetical protein
MTRLTRLSLFAVCAAVVSACSPPPADPDEAEALGRSTDETVFDDMIETQDRARAVEDVTMEAKAATDAAIERQAGEEEESDR